MTTHYDPGDIVTVINNPGQALLSYMIVREVTAAEITDLSPVYTTLTAPAFWVVGVGSPVAPEVRVTGSLYGGATFILGSAIVTVIKASGDNDTIAGLLT